MAFRTKILAGAALLAGPVPAASADEARLVGMTAPAESFAAAEPYEAYPAGAASAGARGAKAFSQPFANLAPERALDFILGEALFEKIWVSAPASTKASDGLGPHYNARACSACHVNDGRGHPPGEESSVSLVLHVAVPADPLAGMAEIEGYLSTAPDPVYGAQIQTFAMIGLAAEARLDVRYQPVKVALSGGESVTLRAPSYAPDDLAYGPLAPGAMLSPRAAPPMIGLGLIEAIPEEDILAGADPDDADGDGISGRANIVWSPAREEPALGRFGLKAGTASVAEQSALAFATDMGISSPLHPAPWGDCTTAQQDCRAAPHGDKDVRGTEIDARAFDLLTLYASSLAVPLRPDAGVPEVLRGKQVFYETGCIACHRPKFVTGPTDASPAPSAQLIWPYSDFLLHDMGEGLADGFVEGRATGREWRTAPLWGIGLTEAVSGETTYLHDGRARSLLEAILWHGGEAGPARDAVMMMPAADRAALIRFLESL